MTYTASIGALAALLTTVAFVPQVVRVIRTRDTHAISLFMYLLFSLGVALWCVYGLLLGLWPVVVANVITLALALVVLVLKLRGN
ncbi:MAG: SemiSWEET transporter [Chromatiaceae bacterium]|nr:SemiSWEET transporter [Gammaproteobacteria bacterium]MCP5301308.1 SemiSWEET transporter [Chromatiaceae bacterium]MCP5421926.1 SemiSWEET transporter [Chromatiaceae bacterium]